MLAKRIIPCLDVRDRRTVKGTKFQNIRDAGDPVELALRYQSQGADELVFLDISATIEGRLAMINVVEQVAASLMIPFTVGGGVNSLDDATTLLSAGADKVATNSAAVARPDLIGEIADVHGNQCCVVAIDARRGDGYWQVLTHGGRRDSGRDALQWAREAADRGAGEILLTSWDRDGTGEGFDLELTSAVAESVSIPVIASGGAGGAGAFIEVFRKAAADAALAAGIFHFGQVDIRELKQELHQAEIEVRLC